tara:strand:- start:293 stop:499 length:207 start_codon:yes stop_codon:yes gene_type:complete
MSRYQTDKYERDNETGALLSVDRAGLQAYRNKKKQTIQVHEMSNDINSLKKEFSEIKSVLQQLVQKFE